MKLITALLLTLLSNFSHAIEVDSISVQLFYNGSGSFSSNILEEKDFTLWNTIIGEGSAAEASDSFLIKIKFSGPKESYKNEKVELVVNAAGTEKILYAQSFSGFLFNKNGFTYHSALISGQNCQPLEIVVGSIKQKVDFHCGE